jgi:hypothetical protein
MTQINEMEAKLLKLTPKVGASTVGAPSVGKTTSDSQEMKGTFPLW